MGSIFRIIAAVLAGMLVAMGVITGVEWLNSMLYPMPPGLDPRNPEQVKVFAAQLPVAAFLVILCGWALGTLAGAFVATRVGPDRRIGPGMVVGAILLSSSVAIMRMIPHPTFMWVGAFVVFPLFTYLGVMLGRGPAANREAAGKLF